MPGVSRRTVIRGVSAATIAGLAGCAGGDGDDGGATTAPSDGTDEPVDYPTETVRLVVPYASGGGFDSYARLTQPAWERHLPTEPNVIVENVTGGGGLIGTREIFNADPDGHTLGFTSTDNGVPIQIANSELDFREATPIGILTSAPSVALLHDDVGASTWDELVDVLPDINIATAGFGTAPHLLWIMLGALTGEYDPDELNFVHYEGTGNLVEGLQSGDALALILGVGSANSIDDAIEPMQEFLGFTSPDMADYFIRDVMFSSELDVSGMEEYNTVSHVNRFFFGPPGIPSGVQEIIESAFLDLVEDDQFLAEAEESGRPVISPTGSDELMETIDRYTEVYSEEPMLSIINEAWGG